VQGNKEYKSYDYVYGPILFDKMNNPVYVANDSLGEYTYRTRVMSGNIEGETFEGNIYDYKITPSGKIAYIVSTQRPGLKKDEFIYESYLVNNGEEGEYFSSVSNLTFNDNGVPSYIASDKNNKYFVVKADKKMSEKYDNILNYSYLGDGSLEYEAVNYGNYDKHIPDKYFVHVSGKNYGPFESISVADYSTGKYVLTDNNKYAFITGRLTDRDKYLYKYKVITGEWESIEHDYIEDGRIINGKIMFVSSDLFDKENYISRYALYIDNKTAADDYSSLVFFDADKLSGKASYIGCKGNSFYLLEY
jgi:hypothetical protein